MKIEGKTVFLTGALGGIGRAVARRLHAAGGVMIISDRPGHPAADEFAASLPGARYIGHDLGDTHATKALGAALAAEYGAIDILVNNAALIINRPFLEFSLEDYEEQLRVNAASAFALIQAVAPSMQAKKYGKIINFCSVTLTGVVEGYVPYVASKGALYGLTKTIARELGRDGVRVNAISPGAVRSESEDRVFADRLEAYDAWIKDKQSLKTRIYPEHIADLVLFLAAAESDMITGQNITIDGGW